MNPPSVATDRTTYQAATHVPTVLIVEDDLVLSRMYSEKFTIDGFKVEVIHDGQKALEFLEKHTPDCVLLDLHIPILDGLSVLEQVQKKSIHIPPVLALTNVADPQQKARAIKLGVQEYLVKAMLTPEQVVQKVKMAMSPQSGPVLH